MTLVGFVSFSSSVKLHLVWYIVLFVLLFIFTLETTRGGIYKAIATDVMHASRRNVMKQCVPWTLNTRQLNA
eukprot:2147993-Amphidinium_carterae.1